jgi:hypothetical protein
VLLTRSERRTTADEGVDVVDKMNARKFLRGVYSPVTLAVGFVFLLDAVTV